MADQVLVLGGIILDAFRASFVLVSSLLLSAAMCAQSSPADNSRLNTESSSAFAVVPANSASDALPAAPVPVANPNVPASATSAYVPPTEGEKFHNYTWNALGPVAFAGSSVAAAIDQGFNFPHAWGQGADAYGARVASNLGISLVTATAQYSLAEAFHEDTKYYRCACSGFLPRFWHAAVSSVASRRGEDGHTAFSIALTASPFVGPMVAANSWIPSKDGPNLGFKMGYHNLMGQFGQNEALEFLYGGPHTLLARLQNRLFKK